ncbi:MAG TPA: hypothetical protein GXZ89_00580 [Fastidiosipila sp.]|nr:hypothetical protein [Fastidiosipila sp.]
MIYTVTFNPAWDERIFFDDSGNETKRYGEAGGKGINVSRALTKLGVPNIAYLWSAGATGKKLEARLMESGIQYERFTGEGETRVNLKRILEATGETTEENEIGDVQSEVLAWRLVESLQKKLTPADTVVMSGSLAPGFPATLYQSVVERLSSVGCRIVLDASGEPLRHAAHTGLTLLSPNEDEFCHWLGLSKPKDEDLAKALLEASVSTGAAILLSRGADGAWLSVDDLVFKAKSDVVRVEQTTGAGDVLLGAFLAAASRYEESHIVLSKAVRTAAHFVAGQDISAGLLD